MSLAAGGSLGSLGDINRGSLAKRGAPFVTGLAGGACSKRSLWRESSLPLQTILSGFKPLSPVTQASEIDERRIQSCVHFMTLKKLNRLAHIRLKKGRDQTHEVQRGWGARDAGWDLGVLEMVPFLPALCLDVWEELNSSQVVIFELDVYQTLYCGAVEAVIIMKNDRAVSASLLNITGSQKALSQESDVQQA